MSASSEGIYNYIASFDHLLVCKVGFVLERTLSLSRIARSEKSGLVYVFYFVSMYE